MADRVATNIMKTINCSVLALAAVLSFSVRALGDVASVNLDSSSIAQGVKAGLGDPSRFNWESVRVTELSVDGGKLRADLTKDGDVVRARVHGEHIFTVTAKGKGDRDSALHVSASLKDLDGTISLADRRAEVDAVLQVVNHASCRVWTRAKHVSTLFDRMTFRLTAIPQPCDVKLVCRIRIDVKNDGTVVLTPVSWRPTNPNEKIDIKISGQKLPDGWATIKPLNVETTRVDMDLPLDWGDRTIKNPLVSIMEKVIGREFVLGKLPL